MISTPMAGSHRAPWPTPQLAAATPLLRLAVDPSPLRCAGETWPCDCSPRVPAPAQAVLQSPEGEIEPPLIDQQCVIALPADEVRDGISVKLAPDQGREDKNVERATQKFEFGSIHSFPEF
jgi:hypothetical protein